jgi:phthiodiolone/phenolphthiodiolone dimycocerosates ketoreductase
MAMLLPEEVWRRYGADHPLGSGHKGFIDIVPARVTDEQIDDARRTLRPEMLEESMFAGSPSEIRDEVEALVDAGCRHVIISNITAVLSGATAADFWRLVSLIRKLRRLGYEPA